MIYTLTLNPALDSELVVDQFAFNQVSRAKSSRVDCGGKGFNVSRLLNALGEPTIAMGFVGGHTGARLAEALQAEGIETDFTVIAGETRTNVSIVLSDEAKHLKVNEPGPKVSDTELKQLFAQIRANLKAGDWWVLAGSLPAGAPANLYAELTTMIQQAGAHVILDASGDALRLGCAARPELIKPNREEALELLGISSQQSTSDLNWVNDVLALGPRRLVISMGDDGAIYAEGGEILTQPTPQIEERSAIGAGDSLVAGLVYQLSRGETLATAVRFGAACGAATASRAGTQLGTEAHIRQLFSQLTHQTKPAIYAMP